MIIIDKYFREKSFISVLGQFERLQVLGNNKTKLEFFKGNVYFSYNSPVLIELKKPVEFLGKTLKPGYYFLPMFNYSKTTIKHIKKFNQRDDSFKNIKKDIEKSEKYNFIGFLSFK